MLIPRLKLQDFSSLRKILQDATEMLNSNKANLSSIVGGRLPDFLREYVVGSVNEKRPSNTADRLQLSEISPSARSSEVRLLTRSKAPGFEKPGLLLNRVDQGRGGTALRSQPCSGVGARSIPPASSTTRMYTVCIGKFGRSCWKILDGSCSAVSKPIFATKNSFCSICKREDFLNMYKIYLCTFGIQ